MRVAVIGSGVAGLGAAYALSRAHDVTVFEREHRPGGHANTVSVDGYALDTGFLVHNERNYPLLTRLFAELGVRTQPTDMSFSVSCRECGLEYAGRRPFAQLRNATSVRFNLLLWEICRWLRSARRSLDDDLDGWTLQRYLDANGYSAGFRRHFLVPLTSALWSSAPGRALELPAAYAIRFFDNHGMLGLRRFHWCSVAGGSRTYVDAIVRRLGGIRTGLPVRSVRREEGGALVRTDDDVVHGFERVVVATHADEALALLEDPTLDEQRILGAFPYSVNHAVLHTDAAFLPRAAAARASWNSRVTDGGGATVTYWLNSLQRLEAERDYLVTLNGDVADEHALARFRYRHPLFTLAALDAQARLPALATRTTAFAGAYHGNGFHEDGLASGLRAAAALGVRS
jgi:predicted NAD/FAD-binding protein